MRSAAIAVIGTLFLLACSSTVVGTGASSSSGSSGSSGDDTTGTGGGKVTIDANRLCNLIVTQCQLDSLTLSDCVEVYQASRFVPACAERVRTATCDDISELEGLCFPPCDAEGATCNTDGTITTCSEGKTYNFACEGVCRQNAASYTGTCGTSSPDGETSPTAKCWCQ